MSLSKCVVFQSKKLRFIKKEEASGLLSCFSQISLSQIALLHPILF